MNDIEFEKLKTAAKSIANDIECEGSIVIAYYKDGVSMGMEGLSAKQVHHALKQCLKLGFGQIGKT